MKNLKIGSEIKTKMVLQTKLILNGVSIGRGKTRIIKFRLCPLTWLESGKNTRLMRTVGFCPNTTNAYSHAPTTGTVHAIS